MANPSAPAAPRTGWDSLEGFAFDADRILDFIASAPTCVFIRLRADGHPVGTVVGHRVIDGQIYTSTNVFRAAYKSILRDPRCSAVFDNPGQGMVTVIGRAEIVDDPEFIRRSYRGRGERHYLVTSGRMTAEEYERNACTPNRRLIHVIPEKFISHDMSKLRLRA